MGQETNIGVVYEVSWFVWARETNLNLFVFLGQGYENPTIFWVRGVAKPFRGQGNTKLQFSWARKTSIYSFPGPGKSNYSFPGPGLGG